MNDEPFWRWFACSDCGGRMLSVGGIAGHWLMSQEKACRARPERRRRPDPWQLRR